jgi:hypothetical protein
VPAVAWYRACCSASGVLHSWIARGCPMLCLPAHLTVASLMQPVRQACSSTCSTGGRQGAGSGGRWTPAATHHILPPHLQRALPAALPGLDVMLGSPVHFKGPQDSQGALLGGGRSPYYTHLGQASAELQLLRAVQGKVPAPPRALHLRPAPAAGHQAATSKTPHVGGTGAAPLGISRRGGEGRRWWQASVMPSMRCARMPARLLPRVGRVTTTSPVFSLSL